MHVLNSATYYFLAFKFGVFGKHCRIYIILVTAACPFYFGSIRNYYKKYEEFVYIVYKYFVIKIKYKLLQIFI
jgi:hypothetical protein